jgi:hypothetical protein
MEYQTLGVQWPTVTQPTDNTDYMLLAAARLCVCRHPVYFPGNSRVARGRVDFGADSYGPE